MQQSQIPAKSTRTLKAAPKVTAQAVTALQGRVAKVVGSGTLDSAPFSYHH
ncbi:hypothetical protein QT196_39100 (plasmid) [Streptomyces sp. P9-2B-2]|uniref:hypothetical protein n=1 Tax=Streptomyces sp. P9-2B-2 TaxID=3057114 RepID=UPI0025B3BFC8|nr:hypothetical protein [Streptomyces sp. P9-2B-2]WJY43269.1 hypothetical protein QT196_39100 [Streptomyces sp. P9-2B-2]